MNGTYCISYSDELAHHSVLGMKWGVRKDSIASSSKTRRGQSEKQKQKMSEKQKQKDVRNRGTLTTEYLEEKIKRLQLEKQLRELTDSEVNAGRKEVTGILKDIGKKVVITAGTGALLYGAKAAVSGEWNLKDLGSAIFNGGAKKK